MGYMKTAISVLFTVLIVHSTTFVSAQLQTHTTDLSLCLAANNISNFTNDATSSSFHTLFYISVQNLRFANAARPTPAAVILPETLHQLRDAVLCCRAHGVSIRIRSGGHSYEGLSYTAPPDTSFAVIDMMNLNRVTVDPASRTAWVESGATLGEAYHAIAAASATLAFPAGSCPTVGSGGHIAGGGFGLLSRKYGLAADNVLDAVLIDANGRVLDRGTMGEDAFWAVRGGGGGTWGAVYAWKLRLVPVPDRVTVFAVSRRGPTGHVARLVDAWQRVAPALQDEFYLSAFVGSNLSESGRTGFSATFKGLYLGPKTEAVSTATWTFPELDLSDMDCREMSWIESAVFFSGLRHGATVSDLTDRILHSKNAFKAKSDYVRAPIREQDLIEAFDLMEQEPKMYMILDPYGGFMGRVGSADLPFPHRAGNLYSIQYMVEWEGGDDGDERYLRWLRRFYEYMTPLVTQGPRAAYVNYLDLDLGSSKLPAAPDVDGEFAEHHRTLAKTWGEKYFLGNYDRLVRVKTAIDPCNVFSNTQSIPPSPGRCRKLVAAAAGEDGSVVNSSSAVDVAHVVNYI
ncbi:hypothetical protein Taro_028149 [Colocasia esculenta]|uniref:FAD-binding PCMH-type domain-containing protein n=1 Tax=Colocasia esculenta TaxID=4460 RepID=A0A843VPL3_COLES|nr:hypothetical protein [Colocasia esculenta]